MAFNLSRVLCCFPYILNQNGTYSQLLLLLLCKISVPLIFYWYMLLFFLCYRQLTPRISWLVSVCVRVCAEFVLLCMRKWVLVNSNGRRSSKCQLKACPEAKKQKKKNMYEKTNESAAHKANISRFMSTLSTFCMFHFVSQCTCVCVCVRLCWNACKQLCMLMCVCVRVCVSVLHIFICGAWIIDKIKTQMAPEWGLKAAIRSRQWLTKNSQSHTRTHTKTSQKESKINWFTTKHTNRLPVPACRVCLAFVQDTVSHCHRRLRAQSSAATATITAPKCLPLPAWYSRGRGRGRRPGRQLLPIKAAFCGSCNTHGLSSDTTPLPPRSHLFFSCVNLYATH